MAAKNSKKAQQARQTQQSSCDNGQPICRAPKKLVAFPVVRDGGWSRTEGRRRAGQLYRREARDSHSSELLLQNGQVLVTAVVEEQYAQERNAHFLNRKSTNSPPSHGPATQKNGTPSFCFRKKTCVLRFPGEIESTTIGFRFSRFWEKRLT